MASQEKIDAVKLNLPAWRVDLTSWKDDAKIGEVLDTLKGNVNGTIRQFWLDRVNDTSALTDVSDVGSSRPLSQTYQHAKEMLAYWDRLAGTGGLASKNGKIKQRYARERGAGLNPNGGVYVRVD